MAAELVLRSVVKAMSNWLSDDEVAQHWDRNADAWAHALRNGQDEFRELFLNPNFARFVGEIEGKAVLDAGCGEGDSTRILARRGGQVTGVDISTKMIALAREEEQRDPLGIGYRESSVADLRIFEDSSFDAVVSTMAMMNVSRLDLAMTEFMRVLKPGGFLAFSVRHPCFATPGAHEVGTRGGKDNGLLVRHYFVDGSWLEKKLCATVIGEGAPAFFNATRFPHTLSAYMNTVISAGFTLTSVEEPRPTEDVAREHPLLSFWYRHAALYLFVRAEKPA